MKIATFRVLAAIAAGLSIAAAPFCLFAGAEFSADMVQNGPQGEVSKGKMFVGDEQVRVEMSLQGQELIRISDEKRGVEWMLFPSQKKYMEQKVGASGAEGHGLGSTAGENPCMGLPGLTCNKLGEEEMQGRTAVKWEMIASHEGQTMKSMQWIDKERQVPLRQEMPNGQTTELKIVGEDTLDGRQVEKWEMVVTAPNQPETRTFQWYDPELALAVRQEFPGGMVSELNNIRVGEQPDELFKVPAGYERMSAAQDLPPESN